MLFVSLMRWWYGSGWLDQVNLVRNRFARTADFFSIGLSLRSLFQPFRQIDADRVKRGSLDVVLRTIFDQLFSRFFGAIVRSFLIVIGIIALAAEALVACIRLALWPLLPAGPVVGLVLILSGWILWQ